MTPAWRRGARCALTTFALLGLAAHPSLAARVRFDPPIHRDGQTFLAWTNPNGPGWTFRVYYSSHRIQSSSDLASAVLVGSVGDSTWCDRRLYTITGTPYGYKVDPAGAALTPDKGLFVVTPPFSRNAYYAATAQGPSGVEEMTITVGTNSLASPVLETIATPKPVRQRTLPVNQYWNADVYTLWTTQTATAAFPAMANRASVPFDCGVVAGGSPPQSSLLVSMHARGGNFLQALYPTGYPGEWVLGLDDPVGTRDLNTFWYGYEQDYDITLYNNPVPTGGLVVDYTLRRVLFTVLWARREFPVDTTRVYSYGISMGAIGGMLAALRRPDLFAAVMGVAGKFDFSFVTDPDPTSGFNPGNVLRDACDRLWGTVPTNLPSSEGFPVFSELNAGFMAADIQPAWVPPLLAFNGKNDLVVGWAEKIGFFGAMRDQRQGGTFFWDTRDHLNNGAAAWTPMQDPQYLYRFRTNRSFPGLSSCSADGNPGDGTASSGDSVGTINGCLEWDTTLVDTHDHWETTLHTRDLTTLWGTIAAPESVSVDVTPRRLQSLVVVRDSAFAYDVTRLADGAVILQGTITGDALGLLRVPGVEVYRAGTLVRVWALGNYTSVGTLGVGDPRVAARPQLLLAPNPARGSSSVRVLWAGRGEARVDLLDAVGRRVRTLYRGAAAGSFALRLDAAALPAGLYFVTASQGGQRTVRHLALLR